MGMRWRLGALVLLVLLISGCAGSTAEELYALPQLSEEYIQLQARINELLSTGAEFSAPTAGANRQAVQLEDLDGDGVKEALVFISVSGSAKPLKIVIFRESGGGYEEAVRLEGEGTVIDSVSYLDMDGQGCKELAVGWRIASGMNLLSVYSLRDYQGTNLLNADCTKYAALDLDDDGATELIALRLSSEGVNEAACYFLGADGEVAVSAAPLSADIRTLSRVRTGRLLGGTPMVLLDSTYGSSSSSGLVTDILALREGALVNVTMDETQGVSDTVRPAQIWCRDINGDDLLDVPQLEALPAQPDSSTYYLTRWYDFRATGRATLTATTFVNSTDQWYLRIPNDWVGRFTVRRRDALAGERAVVFSYTGNGLSAAEDFLVIYTLTGDNREERSVSGNRFRLARDEDTIYAAELLTEDFSSFLLTDELIMENFYRLYAEWFTGET